MTDAATEEFPVGRPSASRVEAFSDGVMAIAITLLVIDIRLPESEGDLLKQLLGLWPSYLAYLGSFATIGVIWLSHHAFFAHVRQVNGLLQAGNLLVLLCVAFLPFPTTVLAHHLEDGGRNAGVATAFYFLTAAVQAGAWIVIWVAVRRDSTLLRPGCSAEVARTETRQAVVAFVALAAIAALGLVVPTAALVLYLLAVVGYALPAMAWTRRVRGQRPDLSS
ncbi:TMEM175 family protein [Nocardia sp. CDC159]|uniref:TMEM175 family protein n=1 Tax=Nocardia pulmonis TaxID=2951408 RepID=A0A9X2ECZ0_9NOCA|nr:MULTISPECIES: TMEM175 family protein [Nocardia]MCM6778472.1 TMEM175 family protein [Nocardia pulmonis]MCM6791361.1 TMEM175 family protein [Nocardia sp. CDC159]